MIPRDTSDQYKLTLENIFFREKMIFRDFSIIFCSSPPAGVPKVHKCPGAILFSHFAIYPGLNGRYLGAQKELEGVLGL